MNWTKCHRNCYYTKKKTGSKEKEQKRKIIFNGDLKAHPSKTRNIPQPDFLKVGFQMVVPLKTRQFARFQMVGTKMTFIDLYVGSFGSHFVFTIWNQAKKCRVSNSKYKMVTKKSGFKWISNGKFKMAAKKSLFQMINTRWLPKHHRRYLFPVFECHLQTAYFLPLDI